MHTVKVPTQLESAFAKAQKLIENYFTLHKTDPIHGVIEISDERYILVRAASLSIDFFDLVKEIYSDLGDTEARNMTQQLFFDLAHAIGKQDARNLHKQLNITTPTDKFATGPIHFAYTGWGAVTLHPESQLTSNADYQLIYDHICSFESTAWSKQNKKSTFPVCTMNAGYSSGWCEESFGIPLIATEIMCQAKGDKVCRFIMASPTKLSSVVKSYLNKNPHLASATNTYQIPSFFHEMSQHLHSFKLMRDSEERFRLTFNNAAVGMLIVDLRGKITKCNTALQKILGYLETELEGKNFIDITHPADIPFSVELFQKLLTGKQQTYQIEKRYVRKNGQVIWVNISNALSRNAAEVPQYVISIIEDITARKIAEDILKKYLEYEQVISQIAQSFAEMHHDAIDHGILASFSTITALFAFDHTEIFQFSADKKIIKMTHEWSREETKSYHLCHECSVDKLPKFVQEILIKDIIHIPDVDLLPAELMLNKQALLQENIKSLLYLPLYYQGERRGFIGFYSTHKHTALDKKDIALLRTYSGIIANAINRKFAEEKLEALAKYDNLTNIPNRYEFELTINRDIAYATRHKQILAVLLIDLDKFKDVNDTYGHDIGDLLLKEVARRIHTSIRSEDFVARLGGDEFVVISVGLQAIEQAEIIAKKILDKIKPIYCLEKNQIFSTASIGIACFPQDGNNRVTLLKNADIAMYSAKHAGRNRYQLY